MQYFASLSWTHFSASVTRMQPKTYLPPPKRLSMTLTRMWGASHGRSPSPEGSPSFRLSKVAAAAGSLSAAAASVLCPAFPLLL